MQSSLGQSRKDAPWCTNWSETRNLLGIINQTTNELTCMAVSAVKEYFGSQDCIYKSLGKPASGVLIHNIIYTAIISDMIGGDDVMNSIEFSTWGDRDKYLFEKFYNGFCELLENDGI